MRPLLFLAPLLIAAAPPPADSPAHSAARKMDEVDRVLNDPRTMEQITRSMQAMTDAFLKLPVGELEAAFEGRSATAAEKRRTVRDVAGANGADLKRQIAEARPMIEQSVNAMKASIPALVKSFEEAGKAIERAQANMPTPGYPKR